MDLDVIDQRLTAIAVCLREARAAQEPLAVRVHAQRADALLDARLDAQRGTWPTWDDAA